MVINKITSNILKFVEVHFVRTALVGIISVNHFLSLLFLIIYDFITCDHTIFTTTCNRIPKKFFLAHIILQIFTHIKIYCFSTFEFNGIFYHQIYIYICMKYACLMLSIHLFLKSFWKCLHLIFFCLKCVFY